MTTPMKEGYYYDAQLIAMGRDDNGDLTADEDGWENGQSIWNILVMIRSDEDEYVEEAFDLDFPVTMRQLAEVTFDIIERTIEICSRQNIEIY